MSEFEIENQGIAGPEFSFMTVRKEGRIVGIEIKERMTEGFGLIILNKDGILSLINALFKVRSDICSEED